MHLTRIENSDTKRVSLFWHTRYIITIAVFAQRFWIDFVIQ